MAHRVSYIQVTDPQQVPALEAQGYHKCLNPRCSAWFTPEEMEQFTISCPVCKMTYKPSTYAPFGAEGAQEEDHDANREYSTQVGLSMKEQGDIGEEIVKSQKVVPGYGAITWTSGTYNDPIDLATKEWAIEVKTICIDTKNHRFIPGSRKRKEDMINRAKELGYEQILGLLVIVDYRTSMANVYAMEMPLEPWKAQNGQTVQGPVAFRKHNGQHLIEEVPFKNPFMDPNNSEPNVQKTEPQPEDFF